MKIYTLWVTRSSEPETPELVDAWDENLVDAEADAYADLKKRWMAAGDVLAFAEVVLDVPDGAVLSALRPGGAVPAVVVEP